MWTLLLAGVGPLAPGPGGCLVRARVVDGDGRPVADARLGAASLTSRESGRGRTAPADADGRVLLPLPRGLYRWAVASASHPTTAEGTLRLLRSCAAAGLGPIVLEPGERLTGRVVDREGDPLDGATVRIGWDPAWPTYLVVTDGHLVRPHRRVTTDAAGRFVLPGLVAGTDYDLAVGKPGYGGESLHATPGAEPRTIVLEPAARLVVEAVDDEGEPVQGARIRLSELGRTEAFQMVYVPVETDEAGRYGVESVAPGEVSIEVRAPGYAVAHRVVTLAAGETRRERIGLAAVPTSPVELRIVDDEGSPVAGARAFLASSPMAPDGTSLSATSDDAGRIAWPRVPRGSYAVTVQPSNETPVEGRRELQIEVAGEAVERRVVLRRLAGRAVEGQVVEADGAPAGGVSVHVYGAQGGAYLETRTDGEGRFRFPLVPFGDQVVHLERPGVAGIPDRRIRVTREAERWLLEVPAGVEVTGRLVLASGVEPRGSWEVAAKRQRGEHLMVRGWAEPDLTYRLPPLAPGSWELEASVETAEGRAEGRSGLELRAAASPARQDIPIELPGDAFPVTGRLLHRGLPLADAYVGLSSTGPGLRGHSVRTDADGAFEMAGVPAGTYEFSVAWGGAPVLMRTITVDGPTDLSRELGFAWVRGRVAVPGVDPSTLVLRLTPRGPGDPALGWVYTTDIYPEFARLRSDGSFEAGPLEEGYWILALEAPGFEKAVREIRIEGADVEGVILAPRPRDLSPATGDEPPRPERRISSPTAALGRRPSGGRP